MFEPYQIAVAVVAILAGSTVVSTVGFGLGMTATPVLLMVLDPQTAVITVNTVVMVVFALVILRHRDCLPVREMTLVSAAGILGALVGVVILSSVDAGVLRLSITCAILVLAAVAAFNVRWSTPRLTILGLPMGFVVGGLVTSLGIGGPLMVLFLMARGWSSRVLRVSLAFFFEVLMLTGVVGYGVAGLYTTSRITLILIVCVPLLVGFRLGSMLVSRLDERTFRWGVIVVIVVSSLMVLGREVLSL